MPQFRLTGPLDLTPAVRRAIQSIKDYIDISVPVGSGKLFFGSAAPTGWLLCDGTAVSRSTYASLFNKIGTSWGVGDGSTTFNLPDLRGRAAIGAGTGSGLSARTFASSGGVEAVTLTSAQSGLPAHNHTQNSHNHTQDAHAHAIGGTGEYLRRDPAYTSGYYGPAGAAGLAIGWASMSSVAATNQAATATNNANTAANAAASHENMQPWAAVNYIIKT
jgi:microcystin-dependent protein